MKIKLGKCENEKVYSGLAFWSNIITKIAAGLLLAASVKQDLTSFVLAIISIILLDLKIEHVKDC